jgi:hypothetical protein
MNISSASVISMLFAFEYLTLKSTVSLTRNTIALPEWVSYLHIGASVFAFLFSFSSAILSFYIADGRYEAAFLLYLAISISALNVSALYFGRWIISSVAAARQNLGTGSRQNTAGTASGQESRICCGLVAADNLSNFKINLGLVTVICIVSVLMQSISIRDRFATFDSAQSWNSPRIRYVSKTGISRTRVLYPGLRFYRASMTSRYISRLSRNTSCAFLIPSRNHLITEQ